MTPPDDTDAFVDGLIAESNPATAAPADKAGKAAPASPSDPAAASEFPDEEYQNENDEAFDPATATPEQKKLWPKKYSNALSRRDKDNTRLKAENAALQQQLRQAQPNNNNGAQAKPGAVAATATKAQENLDAQVAGKPDINDAKYTGDYGKYLEDVAEWKADVRVAEGIKKFSEQQQQQNTQTRETQAAAATEQRITTLAQQEIAKNPEILSIVQENADILDSYPAHILDVIGQIENPVIPLVHLAKTEGALEALGRMTPAQAAVTLGMALAQAQAAAAGSQNGEGDEGADAEAQPTEQPEPPQKKVSAAPQPLKTSKSVNGGKKQLHNMNADEIFQELDL